MLLREEFAPITWNAGFLRGRLDWVAEAFAAWALGAGGGGRATRSQGDLWSNLYRLEPLTVGARPRQLLATTRSDWVAMFDCGAHGGYPETPVAHMTRTLGTDGLVVESVPETPEVPGRQHFYAGRQFQLFGPDPVGLNNYIRTVAVIQDGKRWMFNVTGQAQPFEDTAAYQRRRVKDRLTDDMLVDYCQSLGLPLADPDFFCGPCVLVETHEKSPFPVLSLRQARRELGLEP